MENHKETSFERKNSTCSLCFSARGVFTESQTKEIKEMKTMQTTARNRWTALALLAAIEFMILLDTSIVNIALPSIQSGLHFSEADLGWVQNIYHPLKKQQEVPLFSLAHAQEQLPQVPPAFYAAMRFAGQIQR